MDLSYLAKLSPVDYAVPGFVLLVLAEIIVARFRDRSRYEPKDTLTSLALGLGSTIAGILTGGLFLAIALWVYQFRLFEIGYTWWAFLIVFVLDDFVYYWVHRAGHRIRWAWAAHVIHHSSQHYNLSTALRQTWTGFFGATFILKLPLFLIGFPVPMVAFVGGINLIYQFWIHTEVIGRMPRWFEAVMNTPSHHRVHHATNPRYLDMNYAGVFIVWDKMFGTFTPELDAEKPRYGIVKNLGSFNLVWAAFHEWVGIAKDVWAGADAARQTQLHDQAAGLEPRWQPRDERKHKGAVGAARAGEGCVEQADIVVVGGGSGGAAAAGRLSEDGRYSVALLEAGGRNTGLITRIPGFMGKQTPKTNWAYETVPQKGLNGRRGYQPRGRGMGGSSAINAMLYIRGAAWDYDNWAALGCDGWAYDDVLPVFKRSEANGRGASEYHGADGPLRVSDQVSPHPGSVEFVEAGASLQIPRNDDFNGARQEGVGLYQVTQSGGERWSAARGYVEPARSRPNFSVVTDATAERVLFEDGKVWGVAYARGRQQHVIRASKVVLAGGVFGTPQLLMLSGIGDAKHLAEHGIKPIVNRPAVGANLQDHVDYVAAFEVPGRYFLGQSFVGNLTMMGELLRWLRKRDGALTSPFAEAGGFLTVTPGAPAPDVQFHFVPIVLEDHGRTAVKAHGFSCHVCVLRPESHGTVRLASADVRDAPLIDPAFLSDDRDMTVLKAGVRTMYRILNSPPLNRHGAKDRYPIDLDDDDALDRLIRARADTVYHPVGTARMGSDAEAVCDPKLRVRGVEGLYVADASIMPKLVSGNTNAPSIMIGERCADFVKADHAG